LIGVRISIADDEDAQDPWTLPPSRRQTERPIEGALPETAQIVRANLLYVDKQGLPPAMLNRLLRLAAFQTPEFYKAQAMRLPTYAKPRVIACGQDFPHHIAVPRGCLTEVMALLRAHNIRPEVREERFAGTPIIAEFDGQLRPVQEDGCRRDQRPRRGKSLRPDGVWENGLGGMADRKAQGQYFDSGSSATTTRSMAGTAGDVPEYARGLDWACRSTLVLWTGRCARGFSEHVQQGRERISESLRGH